MESPTEICDMKMSSAQRDITLMGLCGTVPLLCEQQEGNGTIEMNH